MRVLLALAGLAALAACAPPVPNTQPMGLYDQSVATGAGVGFGDYGQYNEARARRDAALAAPPGALAPAPVTAAPLGSTFGAPPPASAAAPLDPSIVAAVDAVNGGAGSLVPPPIPPADPAGLGPVPFGVPGTIASFPEPAPVPPAPFPPVTAQGVPLDAPLPAAAPGISDEQDFAAVAARETIESDAERLARLRAQREVVAPQPLPERPADTGPNIVAYALSAQNAVGQPVYRRGGVFGIGRAERSCDGFASADRAQEAFLAAGGPERDRQGLDPDGDGFACGWDPAPFRRAVN